MSGAQQPPPPPLSPVQAAASQNAFLQANRPPLWLVVACMTGAGLLLMAAAWWLFYRERPAREVRPRREVGLAAQPARPDTALPDPGLASKVKAAVTGKPAPVVVPHPPAVRGWSADRPRPPSHAAARAGGREGAEEPKLAGNAVLASDVWRGDAQTMLTPGDTFPCITVQPVSGRAGEGFTARVPEDVRLRGASGPLIPAGSRVYGTVVGVPNQGAEQRIGVAMRHVELPTPEGKPLAVIPLNSPGAGPLGDGGLPANVNTHFWKTLAAVGSYAVVDALSGAGAALLQDAVGGDGQSPTINIGPSFRRGGTTLAQNEWGHQRQRQPTAERPQGQACQVFVQHFVDASRAYREWWRWNPRAAAAAARGGAR